MSCTANEITFSTSASSPVELLCTSLHFMGDAQNKVLPFQLSVPALNYLRLTKKKIPFYFYWVFNTELQILKS